MTQGEQYTVRRIEPRDAAGVVACVRDVYGDAYPWPALYVAQQIVEENRSGRWISAVAVDRAGSIVGHAALEVSKFGPIAELGMAMVLPAHQRSGLHRQLSLFLVGEGKRAGLVGHFSDVETNRAEVLDLPGCLPGRACGLSLGLWPASARSRDSRNVGSRRRSFVLFYRTYAPLPPRVTLHVLPKHFAIIAAIYSQFGVECVAGAAERSAEGGEVQVETLPAWQAMFIRAPVPGRRTVEELAAIHAGFRENSAMESAYLELPMLHPQTPQVCRAAQQLGFLFSGVIPSLFGTSDGIRLQCVKALDLNGLEVRNPMGGRILRAILDGEPEQGPL